MTEQPVEIASNEAAEDAPLEPVTQPGDSGVDAGPQDDYDEEDGHGVPV